MTDEIETGQTPGESAPESSSQSTSTSTYTGTSIINQAIEAVAALINGMNLFATITRGALGIDNGLCCEPGPSSTQEVYLDKGYYIPLTLAINGKHSNLQTLSDALNTIQDTLSMSKTFPSGTGWEIVDITSGIAPRIIGREDNNQWLMACDLVIKIHRKDDD